MSLTVKTALDPQSLTRTIQSEVASLDPDQPVSLVRTMEELTATSILRRRLTMTLLTSFAAVALVLAAVGKANTESFRFGSPNDHKKSASAWRSVRTACTSSSW